MSINDEYEFGECELRALRAANEKMEARKAIEIQRRLAGTLDEVNGDGAFFRQTVMDLSLLLMPKDTRKWLCCTIEYGMELRFYPKYGRGIDQLVLQIPAGSTLARYSKSKYTLDSGPISVQFEMVRSRLLIGRRSGFTPDRKHAVSRAGKGAAMQVVRSAS